MKSLLPDLSLNLTTLKVYSNKEIACAASPIKRCRAPRELTKVQEPTCRSIHTSDIQKTIAHLSITSIPVDHSSCEGYWQNFCKLSPVLSIKETEEKLSRY